MSSLTHFTAFFLVASAVTALVQSMVREPHPRKVLQDSGAFFFWVVVGIAGFSAIIHGLEWAFVR